MTREEIVRISPDGRLVVMAAKREDTVAEGKPSNKEIQKFDTYACDLVKPYQ